MKRRNAPGVLADMFCPHCMAANSEAAHFCHGCLTPLDSFAATDPLASVYAEYDTLGKASRKPRKVIVLVGMWLLVRPVELVLVVMMIEGWRDIIGPDHWSRSVSWDLLLLDLRAVLAIVPTILLWRTTTGCVRMLRGAESHSGPGFEVQMRDQDAGSVEPEPDGTESADDTRDI